MNHFTTVQVKLVFTYFIFSTVHKRTTACP